ncbi:hypothetical protein CHCC20335_3933 [Bacillus paralicheniformis]|nr:hypothetical protein CHCC20335_3933 [Bacillus paralicheniformis]
MSPESFSKNLQEIWTSMVCLPNMMMKERATEGKVLGRPGNDGKPPQKRV